MLRSSERETEILLGNKQLLGIFFVVAVLLGVSFYGGYMVGRAGAGKKPVTAAAAPGPAPSSDPVPKQTPAAGETHSFPADNTATSPNTTPPAAADFPEPSAESSEKPPLGSPKPKLKAPEKAEFEPQSGQEFLQVAAVGKDDAASVVDVLQKKGFRAHAVPKANTKLYRVLVGPVRDAGDLNSTRDALRRTGFREIFVQRY